MTRSASATDLTDAERNVLQPSLPPAAHRGRSRKWSWREIVDGIFDVLRGVVTWRTMPHDLPSWQTVAHDHRLQLREEVRIGLPKPAASRLHRDLAVMGILTGNHYAVASAALGRVISSLTQVQPHEAEQVRGHVARLIRGAA
ncbi:transposase [Deinococcus sp. A31D244]|uniref:transposase n=1 Tax=Deinococcus sp. A31D244 TaxID=3397675 RepID=UPI0039E1F067